MAVVIHDTTIVTGNDAGAILYDAALAVDGRRIVALGPSAGVLARYPGATRVDGRSYLKLTLLNPDVTRRDVGRVLELVKDSATTLAGIAPDLDAELDRDLDAELDAALAGAEAPA